MILFSILFLSAYVLGGVNFSIIVFALLKKDDPRNQFSGNPGAANVYRQAGILWAAVVFFLDMGRAMGVYFLAGAFLVQPAVPWIGLALILGNRYPCFHGFSGGKGVANYFGFVAPLAPVAAGMAALCWYPVLKLSGHPFVASFVMVIILTAGTIHAADFQPLASGGAMATLALIVYSHRQNILRLIAEKKKTVL